MKETNAIDQHVCSGCHHDQEQSQEGENLAVSNDATANAWQDIARASWAPGTSFGQELLRNTGDPLQNQTINQMLGLNFDPNLRDDGRSRLTGAPVQQTSLINWDQLARDGKQIIQPAVYRPAPLVMPDMQRHERLPNRNFRPESLRDRAVSPGDGTGKRLLEPVRDQAVLARVPDALYVGQKGIVTSMNNRRGEQQDYWLSGDAARSLARAQEMLAEKGKSIQISGKNGAGRTVDTQTEIYTRSKGGTQFVAGKPTASNHTRGNALDISNWRDPDVQKALKAAGWRHGDSKGPIKNDLHHWSYPGTVEARRPTRRTYA